MPDSTRESHELHKEPSSADVGSGEANSQTAGNRKTNIAHAPVTGLRNHSLPRRVLPCRRTGLGRGRQNTQFSTIQGSLNIYSKETGF